MFHLVYKIVNIKNNKYYIGVHSTNNIDDGYMGSGVLIRKDIKAHGVESFTREILEIFDNRTSAMDREKSLVDKNTLQDPLCYNLIFGGGGIRTIKERRALFNVAAKKPYINRHIRFNESIYYEWKVQNNFKYNTENVWFKTGIFNPEYVIKSINETYNNLLYNKEAKKFINVLKTKIGYCNNLICIEKPWQDQQNIQTN